MKLITLLFHEASEYKNHYPFNHRYHNYEIPLFYSNELEIIEEPSEGYPAWINLKYDSMIFNVGSNFNISISTSDGLIFRSIDITPVLIHKCLSVLYTKYYGKLISDYGDTEWDLKYCNDRKKKGIYSL